MTTGMNYIDEWSVSVTTPDNLREIIKNKYPDYLSDFESVLDSKRITHFNMFISSKEFVDNYSKWLFDILFSLEEITDMSNYDNYQKRLYGFLSERLLNVYVRHNKLNVLYKPIVNPLDNSFKSFFKRIIRRILRKDVVR